MRQTGAARIFILQYIGLGIFSATRKSSRLHFICIHCKGIGVLKDLQDLRILLDSKVPFVCLESRDESRVMQLLSRLAISQQLPLHRWSASDGLSSDATLENLFVDGDDQGYGHKEPREVLEYIKRQLKPAIYVLCDFHPYLNEAHPLHTRLLKDIALASHAERRTIVFVSHQIQLPVELKHFAASLALSMPDTTQLMSLVREEAKAWSQGNQGRRVRSDKEVLDALVANLNGLSHMDARRLIRGVIYDDGAITVEDIPALNEAKFKLLDLDNVVHFEYDTAHFAEVAGLENLKNWLSLRRETFVLMEKVSMEKVSMDKVATEKVNGDKESGSKQALQLDCPKGILLLGVQGGGKSLSARAVAGMWNVPLLRLDFAALYNKFVGETERNLREALALADTMEPCVLWIDEIEKGLAVDANDEGVSKRLLGTMLTWMSERKSRVFLVATANSLRGLPPEFMRKGRFDEIFFVDLPDASVRASIFDIHMQKRGIKTAGFSLDKLSQLCEGFSGAEIEQVVVSALYRAKASDDELAQHHLETAILTTVPLSLTLFEEIDAIRQWAKERTVAAH